MLNVDTGAAALVDAAYGIVNKIWPDKTEQEKLELVAYYDVIKAQIEVNKVEAASTDRFTSGWRPFIGWCCGFGLLYAAVLEPLARFVAQVTLSYNGVFPAIDTTLTMQILFGMLGLGGMRTYEKMKGVSK